MPNPGRLHPGNLRGRLLLGEYRSTVLTTACPTCGKRAVIKLPDAVLAEQPDQTTHVCHPLAGGCNGGFTMATLIFYG